MNQNGTSSGLEMWVLIRSQHLSSTFGAGVPIKTRLESYITKLATHLTYDLRHAVAVVNMRVASRWRTGARQCLSERIKRCKGSLPLLKAGLPLSTRRCLSKRIKRCTGSLPLLTTRHCCWGMWDVVDMHI